MSRVRKSSTDDTLADRLHSVAIHLLRRVRFTDLKAPVTPRRLSVLSVLVFGGEQRLKDLADAEQVSAATMSRMVDGLVDEALVARRASPCDRREIVVAATTRGRRVMHQARRRRVAALESVLDPLARADRRLIETGLALLEPLLIEHGFKQGDES